ncbi:hypothetical protein BDR07DRAFT_1493711 [Suillus spraguei]|nr:hypothetical protein BDR07DRAFT_1493711 [Suillus spraguei]
MKIPYITVPASLLSKGKRPCSQKESVPALKRKASPSLLSKGKRPCSQKESVPALKRQPSLSLLSKGKRIILSGSPYSVYDEDAPHADPRFLLYLFISYWTDCPPDLYDKVSPYRIVSSGRDGHISGLNSRRDSFLAAFH